MKEKARFRDRESWKPNLICKHDGAYALQEGVALRYCPQCGLLTTGVHGQYSIYMHPEVLKDLAVAEAGAPIDWSALHHAIAEIASKGGEAGEPLEDE